MTAAGWAVCAAMIAAGVVATAARPALQARPTGAQATFPEASWRRCPDADDAGAKARDARLRETLAAGDSTGVLVVVGGCVRFEYGNVTEVSYLASARKSVVAMLYGPAIARGQVALSSTLESLGIDDRGGLLPRERQATIANLLAARSGVYHPAANLGDASDRAPARGSQEPGTYFLYNNWDFNALEAILERATRRSVYELISSEFAGPLGFEDWDARPDAYAQAVRNDTGASDFPAHHIVLSTRDMARLGYLMLRQGRWQDRVVLDPAWVRSISSPVTSADEVARTSQFVPGLAYGRLWWVLQGAPFRGTSLEGAYTASGAYGQFITVIPSLDAVIAHKTSGTPARNLPPERYFSAILPAVVALLERTGAPL